MRRSGAHSLARRALAPWKIKFLGRWGSQEVDKYIGEAFADIAASFSLEAAAGSTGDDRQSRSRPAADLLRIRAIRRSLRAVYEIWSIEDMRSQWSWTKATHE